jgi:flagellar protein FlbD
LKIRAQTSQKQCAKQAAFQAVITFRPSGLKSCENLKNSQLGTDEGGSNSVQKLGGRVIQLTRLNDQPLVVNSDLIKLVENAHDTVLTLITGEKIVVRERVEEVIERVIQFRRSVLAGMPLAGANLAALTPQTEDADRSMGGTSRG